jgi:hypothetical protein
MALPIIEAPKYTTRIPSTGKNVEFRPFLVKEEKLLLMAKESGDPADIFEAVRQVVQNCCLDSKLKFDKLALFDLEYLFLKIRSSSVDNKVNIGYRDDEDNKIYSFEVNLDNVKIIFPEKNDNVIKITDKTGIVMNYPKASLYSDREFLTSERDQLFKLIVRCIDQIYDNDQVYEAADFKPEQLEEFLENLDIKVFERVHKFLINSPKLEYVIEYENSIENKRKITLSSLNDFFTWR